MHKLVIHLVDHYMAYNNVFRLLFGYRRSCSASEMCVYNNIYNFEGRLRKILMILLCELAAAVMF